LKFMLPLPTLLQTAMIYERLGPCHYPVTSAMLQCKFLPPFPYLLNFVTVTVVAIVVFAVFIFTTFAMRMRLKTCNQFEGRFRVFLRSFKQ